MDAGLGNGTGGTRVVRPPKVIATGQRLPDRIFMERLKLVLDTINSRNRKSLGVPSSTEINLAWLARRIESYSEKEFQEGKRKKPITEGTLQHWFSTMASAEDSPQPSGRGVHYWPVMQRVLASINPEYVNMLTEGGSGPRWNNNEANVLPPPGYPMIPQTKDSISLFEVEKNIDGKTYIATLPRGSVSLSYLHSEPDRYAIAPRGSDMWPLVSEHDTLIFSVTAKARNNDIVLLKNDNDNSKSNVLPFRREVILGLLVGETTSAWKLAFFNPSYHTEEISKSKFNVIHKCVNIDKG
jgi:hypothetical protein